MNAAPHPRKRRAGARHQAARLPCMDLLEGRRLMTAAVPRFDHIVIVVEENHSATNVIGSAAAPYINSLAAGGALR